jgi:NitT/TauT family transport system permease protein
MMIGIIGLGTDLVLALLGRKLFPWDRTLKA